MMLIYARQPRLHITVDRDGRAIDYERRQGIAKGAIAVERLRLTFQRPAIDANALWIDASGFITLLGWIYRSRRRVTAKIIRNRLCDLLPGEPHLSAMHRAVTRAVLLDGSGCGGEAAFHVALVRQRLRETGELAPMRQAIAD